MLNVQQNEFVVYFWEIKLTIKTWSYDGRCKYIMVATFSRSSRFSFTNGIPSVADSQYIAILSAIAPPFCRLLIPH